jgi:hypothetical protein
MKMIMQSYLYPLYLYIIFIYFYQYRSRLLIYKFKRIVLNSCAYHKIIYICHVWITQYFSYIEFKFSLPSWYIAYVNITSMSHSLGWQRFIRRLEFILRRHSMASVTNTFALVFERLSVQTFSSLVSIYNFF